MKCPHCGLLNPQSAQRCDCGYDFRTASLQPSYLTSRQQTGGTTAGQSQATGRHWAMACLLGAFFGMVVAGRLAAADPGGGPHAGGGFTPVVLAMVSLPVALAIVVGIGLRSTRTHVFLGNMLIAAGCAFLASAWFVELFAPRP